MEHTATLLGNGEVLTAGGSDASTFYSSSELYLPAFLTSAGGSIFDFDGDGMTDLAVWRPSNGTWYVKLSSGGAPMVAQWGDQASGDKPVNRPVHLWGSP